MARLVWLAVAACAAGCGGPPLYPVEGRVTLDGKPLPTGDVTLYPDAGPLPSDRVPLGSLDADGRFRILTGGRVGVPAGTYRVAVVAQTRTRPAGMPANPMSLYPLIGVKFFAPETSPLRVTVGPDAPPGAYDLSVTR